MVEIHVGVENPVSYYAHEEVLCDSSAFFKGALSHSWKEAEQRCVHLPEEEPKIFDIYMHWLCRGALPVPLHEMSPEDYDIDPLDDQLHLLYAKAYVLGDRMQAGDFMDVVIDKIIDLLRRQIKDERQEFVPLHVVRYVYDNTPDSCILRLLLAYTFARHGHGSSLGSDGEVPQSFLYHLGVALIDRAKIPQEWKPLTKDDACLYHQHGDGPCYKDRHKNIWELEELNMTPYESERTEVNDYIEHRPGAGREYMARAFLSN